MFTTLTMLPLVLVAMGAIEVAESHPRLREVPKGPNRTLAKGPARFVAADGDNAGDGSENRPWKTIGHAVTKLRPGDTLYLRGGTYYEQVYLALTGRPDAPITIRSYPGEQAIIDGSLAEFTQSPATAWQPDPAGEGRYISTKAYPNQRDILGYFGDSQIGLQTYYYAKDLFAKSELIDWENWDDTENSDLKPLYCGPGLWLDRATGRIHCRLAHTHLPEPVANYKGETDPRKLPLIVAPFDSVPLTLDAVRHVRLQDLTIRGAGYHAVKLKDCQHVEIDNCTVWCGAYGLDLTGTEHFRLVNSRLFGSVAPWTSRSDASKRDYPGRPHRNLTRLNTHALLAIDSGRESSVFAYPQNDKWEIAHCHFADAHDGLYLGTINCQFHGNLVENLQDDGIYLSPMYQRHRLEKTDPQIHVFSNTFRQLLTPLAFGGDVAATYDTIFIYRNLIDLRRPVYTGRPSVREAEARISTGKPMGDHGSPPWPAMNIYHNTFVIAEPARDAALVTLGATRAGNPRRVFNNLYVHQARLPGFVPPAADGDVISDGNCYWSPLADEKQAAALFNKFRASEQFAASQQKYPPGCEANSRCADPRLTALPADPFAASDFSPAAGSPLVDAGVPVSADWPDPLRSADAGQPDIGAIPAKKK